MEVELVLSIVLAGSTVLYTLINLLMLFESRATRKQKTTPMIISFLKVTEDHMTLCVHLKNVGEGCAKNVKIEVLKDYNQFKKSNLPLSNCLCFKNGVSVFPSGYELQYYLDNTCDIDYSVNDNCIELKIEYKDMNDKEYKNNIFKLPFNQVVGGNYSNPPESYIGKISHYLKEINNTINKHHIL